VGIFEEQIWSDARFTLGAALDTAESDYRQDFDERWGLDAVQPPPGTDHDDWLRAKRLGGLARQIAEAGYTLLMRKGLGKQTLAHPQLLQESAGEHQQRIDRALTFIHEQYGEDMWWTLHRALLPSDLDDPRTEFGLFQSVLQLEAATLFPYKLYAIAERLRFLVGHLVKYRGNRMAAYLSRVTSCYVLSLPTEFAVMARAVLDSALEEVVDDETVRATVGSGPDLGLERRIAYFEAIGVFDAEASRAARNVKKAGDDAAHTAPGLEPSLETLLADLAKALSALPDHR
jgi:hypothetical protein